MIHVLITRPLPEAHQTAEQIRLQGMIPHIAPLLIVTPRPYTIEIHKGYDRVLITSLNAAKTIVENPTLQSWIKQQQFAVVGEKTKDLLTAHQALVKECEQDSCHLAEKLRNTPALKSYLYITTAQRKGHLETSLTEQGAHIDLVMSYHVEEATQLPPQIKQDLMTNTIHAVLFYSARTASVFSKLTHEYQRELTRIKLCSISSAVDEKLKHFSQHQRFIAKSPNEKALLEGLQ